MMIFGRRIAGRLIAMAVGAILLIAIIAFGVTQCDKRRDQAAQSRVERSQSDAASNSAADAIGTVSEAGKRETASESLTRDNERMIREAEGASDRVNSGVDLAGRKALCQRHAYRNDPRCEGVRQ
jgi:hypothetical protein